MRRRLLSLLIAVFVCLVGAITVLPGSGFIARASAQTPAVAEEEPMAPQDEPATASEIADAAAVAVEKHELVDVHTAQAAGVSRNVLDLALGAVTCAVNAGDIAAPPTLTLIDYSRPSTEPRLWVFDLRTGELRFHELVAHGKGTGENLAEHFSDDLNSHQSSLGLFVTRDTYVGSNGYSLRLDGLDPGFNSRARERAIVMHGAAYVDPAFAAKQGRLGRSWGCPALREAVAHQVIDFVRGGGVIFAYYPDQQWLNSSRFLHCPATRPAGVLAANN